MTRRIAISLLLFTICAAVPLPGKAADLFVQRAVAHDPAQFRVDLDIFVNRALRRMEAVPGLSIAVVDGGGTVLAAGYGLSDVESRTPVTPDTAFYIASSTKSFTALAISAIAARGDIDLDASLSSWVPDSGVPIEIAGSVTLTDLLSHRSGIDNSAIAYRVAYSGDWSPELLWHLTSETRPLDDGGYGTFRYGNAGYNLATVLLEHHFQRDWRTMVTDEVLVPLGMTHTTANIDEVRRSRQAVAPGYLGLEPGHPERAYLQKTDQTMHSAGGLVSTANDMALWLHAQINDGVVDGHRVLPTGLVASTHASRVSQDNTFGPYVRTGYALGWQVGTYGDDLLLHHFGSFSGSRAHVSFMPDRRLGVAVMINENSISGDLADLVANYAYDWFAGVPGLDAAYEAKLTALVATRDMRRQGLAGARLARAQRPRMLSLPDAAYVGDYVSAALGEMRVNETGQGLQISIGVQHAVAENFTQPESVRVELTPLAGEPVVFSLDEAGQPMALTYAGEMFLRR